MIGMARAAVRPRRARLGEDRVPARRHPRPRRGRRAGRGRRRRRPPRLRHRRRRRARAARSTSRARATSSRRPPRPAPSGSSTPRRSPPTASTAAARAARRGRRRRAAPRATPTRRTRPRSRRELAEALAGSTTEAYVFRPCIVAGPEATLLLDLIPLLAIGQRMPGAGALALFGQVPGLRPVLPDPGVPFQLVHHDDVAAALVRRGARPRRARRLQPRRRRAS